MSCTSSCSRSSRGERRRRAQERVLLPAVDGGRQHRPGRLAQHVLLRHAPDLLRHRQRADQLDHLVVQERHPALHRVRHLHAVAQHGQDVAGSTVLAHRYSDWFTGVAAGELAAARRGRRGARGKASRAANSAAKSSRHRPVHLEQRPRGRLQPGRHESQHAPRRRRATPPRRRAAAGRARPGCSARSCLQERLDRRRVLALACRAAACRGGSAGSRPGSRRSPRRSAPPCSPRRARRGSAGTSPRRAR